MFHTLKRLLIHAIISWDVIEFTKQKDKYLAYMYFTTKLDL